MALTFDYKVRDRTGNLVQGQLEGDSLALVVGKLREMGYMPVAVTPKATGGVRKEINIPGLSNRVKLAETAVATRQLATMVDSGLSVVRALGLLAAQSENKELARVLGEVLQEVERGSSLSAAVAKFPKIFSTLFVTMVQAGEAGGNLDSVLLDLSATMEKQAVLNRQIRSAMTYPIVVLSVMSIIFLALLIFIVPVFSKLFKSLHSTIAGADPDRRRHVQDCSESVGRFARRLRRRGCDLVAKVDQDRQRAPQVGRLHAEAAYLRSPRPQGVHRPVLAHSGLADPVRSAHHAVARHRLGHGGQPDRR